MDLLITSIFNGDIERDGLSDAVAPVRAFSCQFTYGPCGESTLLIVKLLYFQLLN